MNLLISDPNLNISAQYLDNKRLVKQILECRQILKIYERLDQGEEKVAYMNHPIVKFYQNNKQLVIDFAIACCDEYTYRYDKIHTYDKELRSICSKKFHILKPDEIIYVEGDHRLSDNTTFAWMREKLIKKWINAKYFVKWAKRDAPKFLCDFIKSHN